MRPCRFLQFDCVMWKDCTLGLPFAVCATRVSVSIDGCQWIHKCLQCYRFCILRYLCAGRVVLLDRISARYPVVSVNCYDACHSKVEVDGFNVYIIFSILVSLPIFEGVVKPYSSRCFQLWFNERARWEFQIVVRARVWSICHHEHPRLMGERLFPFPHDSIPLILYFITLHERTYWNDMRFSLWNNILSGPVAL